MYKLVFYKILLVALSFISLVSHGQTCNKNFRHRLTSTHPKVSFYLTVVSTKYPPYWVKKGDFIEGYAADIACEVIGNADFHFKMLTFSWARAYKMGLDHKNTILVSVGRTEE
ncbi:hypothetical protein, partial [Zooshikella harenae]